MAGKTKTVKIDCGGLQCRYSRAMHIIMTSKSLDAIQGQAAFVQAFNEHVASCSLCAGLREEIDGAIRTKFSAQ